MHLRYLQDRLAVCQTSLPEPAALPKLVEHWPEMKISIMHDDLRSALQSIKQKRVNVVLYYCKTALAQKNQDCCMTLQ